MFKKGVAQKSPAVRAMEKRLQKEIVKQGTANETAVKPVPTTTTEAAPATVPITEDIEINPVEVSESVVVGIPRVISSTVVTGDSPSITIKQKQKGDAYSTQQTTEMLVMVASLGNVTDDILQDNVVKASELFKVVSILPQIPEAVKDAKLIPKELADLSEEEAAQLKKDIARVLNLRHEKTQNIAQLSLDVVLAFSRLVTEIKDAKAVK